MGPTERTLRESSEAIMRSKNLTEQEAQFAILAAGQMILAVQLDKLASRLVKNWDKES